MCYHMVNLETITLSEIKQGIKRLILHAPTYLWYLEKAYSSRQQNKGYQGVRESRVGGQCLKSVNFCLKIWKVPEVDSEGGYTSLWIYSMPLLSGKFYVYVYTTIKKVYMTKLKQKINKKPKARQVWIWPIGHSLPAPGPKPPECWMCLFHLVSIVSMYYYKK